MERDLVLAVVIGAFLAIPSSGYLTFRFGRRAKKSTFSLCRFAVVSFVGVTLAFGGAIGLGARLLLNIGVFEGHGAPGGTAYFSAESKVVSIDGMWEANGSFLPTDPRFVERRPWQIQWVNTDDWGERITVARRYGASLELIVLKGLISIPSDPNLVGRTVEGSIEANLKFPREAGPGEFKVDTRVETVPYKVTIVSPSYLRETVNQIGGGGRRGWFAPWVQWAVLLFAGLVLWGYAEVADLKSSG